MLSSLYTGTYGEQHADKMKHTSHMAPCDPTTNEWFNDVPPEPGYYWHQYSNGNIKPAYVTTKDRAGNRHAKGIQRGARWLISENAPGWWKKAEKPDPPSKPFPDE